MPLRIRGRLNSKLYFVHSVSVDNDCNKRGQTSRPVIGTEIRTSCNFKSNLHSRYYLVGFVCRRFNDLVVESSNNIMASNYRYTTVYNNLDLLLHKDFPLPPSS